MFCLNPVDIIFRVHPGYRVPNGTILKSPLCAESASSFGICPTTPPIGMTVVGRFAPLAVQLLAPVAIWILAHVVRINRNKVRF
jgi:hypothetical protein